MYHEVRKAERIIMGWMPSLLLSRLQERMREHGRCERIDRQSSLYTKNVIRYYQN